MTNWVCNEIIIVSSSILTPKEGWVYQYFFVLKYRRQFKQRQQIMGHCCSKEIFLDKFIGALILCQNERNLSILALILILAAFLFLLHIFGGLNNPNKGISTLTGALEHLLVLFPCHHSAPAPVKSKKIIKFLEARRSAGYPLVSSCFQLSQKFCDLVEKKRGGVGLCYVIHKLHKSHYL